MQSNRLKYWQCQTYLEKVRARFLNEVNSIVQKYTLNNLVLVVDSQTLVLISNLFKIPKLVEYGITFIEKLQVVRKRLEYHAIYYITPTQSNINILKEDFKDTDKPKYKKIHVLFSTFIDKNLLRNIAGCKNLLKKIARNSIKEFYHSIRLVENNTFTLQIQYMPYAYSRDSEEEVYKRKSIGRKLVEILANVGQLNTVRIFYKKQANKISQRIANGLIDVVKQYYGSLLQNKSSIIRKQASDITLLILDRSIDPISPLLHTFSYQPMLFDFMKICFEGKQSLTDKEYFSYQEIQDEIFDNYRYEHISQALENVPKQLQKLQEKIDKMNNQQIIDVQDLSLKIKYLKKHHQFISALWQHFNNKNMKNFGELQSSLATGVTQEGANTSSQALIKQCYNFFKQTYITSTQKIRLGLLLLACIKLSKTDYQTLLKSYSQEEKKILKNFIALGVTYDSSVSRSTKNISKQKQNLAIKRMQITKMGLDRYSTILQLLLPPVINILQGRTMANNLDPDIFGELSFSPFGQQSGGFEINKFCLFMCGGISFNEISSIRRQKLLKNIMIGADELISPEKYVQNLLKINII